MSSSALDPGAFAGVYRGRKVLVTGHTGFKGAWLSEWLCGLGARVTGLALEPATSPALFSQLRLQERIDHRIGDIRDRTLVAQTIARVQPDFIFHLAAQPLVRLSYQAPVETYEVNVMGTVHVLDALRSAERECVAILVTTDKCYENREWVYSYREEDPLGGYDPYSSSKAAAEIAIAAYRRSFFQASPSPAIKIASGRAGNVLGGGDWAPDRIIPDAMRALARGQAIPVRNKIATRPWQHVLEPLSGYLWLGAALSRPELVRGNVAQLAGSFNFGPGLDSNRTVAALVEETLKTYPGTWVDQSDPCAVHEATLLNLSTDKAHHFLRWKPVWSFAETVAQTIQWYASVHQGTDPLGLTREQIISYSVRAAEIGLSWTAHGLA